MKKQASKKKQTATKADATVQLSVDELLSAIDATSGKDIGKRALWGKLMEALPRLGEATAEGGTASKRTKAMRVHALERARRFLDGKCTKRELNAIGVEAVYKILLRLYAELNTANAVYDFYERFSTWEYPDLRAVLEARKQHGGVRVCGEGVDVALKLWELEDSLSFARDDKEREATKQKIDEYKTRLRELGEEVYETLKRAERKASAMGADAREMFEQAKDTALLWGKPDMMQTQRVLFAKWLKTENANGLKYRIGNGVAKYWNENYKTFEAEKSKGGYEKPNLLARGLYGDAAELGIDQFIDHSGKRGRPPKGKARPSK